MSSTLYISGRMAERAGKALQQGDWNLSVSRSDRDTDKFVVAQKPRRTRAIPSPKGGSAYASHADGKNVQSRDEVTGENTAIVEFTARCKKAGRPVTVHELSRFAREDGRWYYVDGDLTGE